LQVDSNIASASRSELIASIDNAFDLLSDVLTRVSASCIPVVHRHFLKHWWSKELSELKAECIAAHRDWVAHGKPRNGHIFSRRQTTRLVYRQKVRQAKRRSDDGFSSKLQDLLVIKKHLQNFGRRGALRSILKLDKFLLMASVTHLT
jgi:hypothetical protein